jgi:hypothetical protein
VIIYLEKVEAEPFHTCRIIVKYLTSKIEPDFDAGNVPLYFKLGSLTTQTV